MSQLINILFLCLGTCIQANQIGTYSSPDQYHVDSTIKTSFINGLRQFAFDSMGTAMMYSSKVDFPLVKDVFTSSKAYAMVNIEGMNTDDIKFPTEESLSVQQNVIQDTDENEFGHLLGSLSVMVELTQPSYKVHCVGDRACLGMKTNQTNEEKDLSKEIEKNSKDFDMDKNEEKEFVQEWTRINSYIQNLKRDSKASTNVYLLSFQSIKAFPADHPKYKKVQEQMNTLILSFVKQMNELYQKDGWISQIIGMNPKQVQSIDKSKESLNNFRKLLVEHINANAPETKSTSQAVPPTYEDITTFQVILWTSVGLSVILLYAIYALFTMDIGRDNLLYAKFRTDGSHRKID